MKEIAKCSECGSTEIEQRVTCWAPMNDSDERDLIVSECTPYWESEYWCPECQEYSFPVTNYTELTNNGEQLSTILDTR